MITVHQETSALILSLWKATTRSYKTVRTSEDSDEVGRKVIGRQVGCEKNIGSKGGGVQVGRYMRLQFGHVLPTQAPPATSTVVRGLCYNHFLDEDLFWLLEPRTWNEYKKLIDLQGMRFWQICSHLSASIVPMGWHTWLDSTVPSFLSSFFSFNTAVYFAWTLFPTQRMASVAYILTTKPKKLTWEYINEVSLSLCSQLH
ncbi:hypothetical protein CPB84DRAFT_566146 [Gymnopilus junonius]|uniref:Uncharacterized protein n=1 Tax=Gymnopilus junonius TaxID=109634 RepID=A0A9P5NVB8_GYMJU|nr:hypothetical protein CPB84DRAFT_566146 [Gymnopilus junonius]